MKKHLFLTGSLLLLCLGITTTSSAQGFSKGVNPAKTITTKGFADKKSTFDPTKLDSLLKCDDYVMLISSFEGCNPCEWLRTSDVFELYPVTPYYTDMLLNSRNATVPQTFYVSGFPTCLFFDKTGEIVAVTSGTANYYEKLDKIVKNKERLCERQLEGLSGEQVLAFYNCMYKANAAYLKGEMDNVNKYATEAMAIYPGFYNRYLLYKYYAGKGDAASADKYKALALDNVNELDGHVYKNLIQELKGEN